MVIASRRCSGAYSFVRVRQWKCRDSRASDSGFRRVRPRPPARWPWSSCRDGPFRPTSRGRVRKWNRGRACSRPPGRRKRELCYGDDFSLVNSPTLRHPSLGFHGVLPTESGYRFGSSTGGFIPHTLRGPRGLQLHATASRLVTRQSEFMKSPGNAHQTNVNAVNALKRKLDPTVPNSSPSRNKTRTEAAASRPPAQSR